MEPKREAKDAYPEIFRWNNSPDLSLGFKGQLGSLILLDSQTRMRQPDKIMPCVSCPETVPLEHRLVNMTYHQEDNLVVCKTCRAALQLEEGAQLSFGHKSKEEGQSRY